MKNLFFVHFLPQGLDAPRKMMQDQTNADFDVSIRLFKLMGKFNLHGQNRVI